MAGTVRRTVRNWTPNDLRVDQARALALELLGRKTNLSAQKLHDVAIDLMLRSHGMLVDPGAPVADTCGVCKAHLSKENVSPWMLKLGFWACGRCFPETVQLREKRLAGERAARAEEERERVRAANGGPLPIRPHPAIQRG